VVYDGVADWGYIMKLDDFLANHVMTSPQQRWFLHFTDQSNLDSIKKHGILSASEIRRLNIKARFGGNKWSIDRDIASGMDAYVHLCFKSDHPMEKGAVEGGTIEKLVRVKIDPEIIKLPGVLITDDVSNKIGVNAAPAVDMLDHLDLDVLYKRMQWKGEVLKRLKLAEKCEILVPKQVPPRFILE